MYFWCYIIKRCHIQTTMTTNKKIKKTLTTFERKCYDVLVASKANSEL